jgi:hypothetical protein
LSLAAARQDDGLPQLSEEAVTTKRIPINRPRHRISPEAIAAYEAGDDRALDAALGLRPWEVSPLRVDQGPGPGGPTAWAASWPKAQQVQREIEKALRAARSDDVPAAPDLPPVT